MKKHLISTLTRIVLISTFALISTVSLFSNDYDRTITREEAASDLEVYFQIIDQQHGNPYQYISRDAFQQLINDKVELLPEVITFKQFDVMLAELNNNLRCGHTVVSMDVNLMKEATYQTQFFPFPIKVIENTVYIDFEQGNIPHGSELTNINGIDVAQMLPELLNLTVTDGYSNTKPLREVESKFGYYYFLKYGASSSFDVSFKNPNGQQESVKVEGVAGNTMLVNNYFRPVNLSHERYNQFTHLDAIDSLETLVLTLNTFQANPDWFYKKVSSRYNENDKEFDFENLVIDLRSNEGGDRRLLSILYQFLTGERLNDPSMTYTRADGIQMKEHLLAINGSTKSDLVVESAETYLRKYFNNEKEDRFEAPVLNWYDEFDSGINWEGAKFEGNIYVMISGKTFSAAADFARILGQMDNVVLLGEETGGAHVGRAANMLANYSLPNTSTVLQVPVIYEEFVNVTADNAGHGTYPDYSVELTLEDLMAKRDAVFTFALNLISQSNTYGSN